MQIEDLIDGNKSSANKKWRRQKSNGDASDENSMATPYQRAPFAPNPRCRREECFRAEAGDVVESSRAERWRPRSEQSQRGR